MRDLQTLQGHRTTAGRFVSPDEGEGASMTIDEIKSNLCFTETQHCGQCGKEYSTNEVYYLLEVQDNTYCHNCHMENASEMVEVFMERGTQ
jgi:hypothetical protein